MKGDALANMLQDRRILVIIVAVIVIIAAAAAYMVLKDDGKGGSDDPSDGLTIDKERTISEDMVIEGTLTITEKGNLTLTDGATISMLGPNAKIDVKGTLDATDGWITFISVDPEDGTETEVFENGKDENRAITSTGTLRISVDNHYSAEIYEGDVVGEHGIINFLSGVKYITGSEVVLTTLSNAVSAAGTDGMELTVTGSYTNTSDNATIGNKISVNFKDGANATFGTVTVSGSGVVDVADGTVTAKIVVGTGILDATKASNINIKASGTSMVVDGELSGSVTVSSGNVLVDNLGVSANGAVTVASGAILTVDDSGTLKGILDANKDAKITVNGIMIIGTKPTKLPVSEDEKAAVGGSISVGATGYVKAYAGVDSLSSESKNTVFYIDNNVYMTVYGSVAIKTVIDGETFGVIESQADIKTVSKWNNAATLAGTALTDSATIGSDDFKAIYYGMTTITLKIEGHENVKIDIDGVERKETSVVLTLGKHHIELYASGGSATAVIGTTPINGDFDITSDMNGKTIKITYTANPESGGTTIPDTETKGDIAKEDGNQKLL